MTFLQDRFWNKQIRGNHVLTPCRQYEPLRKSLISWSSVRREMWVVPTATWDCPPTMMGLWVEVKASSPTGAASSWEESGLSSLDAEQWFSLCGCLTSREAVPKGGLSCSSCSLSNWTSRWGRRGEPARAWQKMAFTGEDLNLQKTQVKEENHEIATACFTKNNK